MLWFPTFAILFLLAFGLCRAAGHADAHAEALERQFGIPPEPPDDPDSTTRVSVREPEFPDWT